MRSSSHWFATRRISSSRKRNIRRARAAPHGAAQLVPKRKAQRRSAGSRQAHHPTYRSRNRNQGTAATNHRKHSCPSPGSTAQPHTTGQQTTRQQPNRPNRTQQPRTTANASKLILSPIRDQCCFPVLVQQHLHRAVRNPDERVEATPRVLHPERLPAIRRAVNTNSMTTTDTPAPRPATDPRLRVNQSREVEA
jgi:hypothetical protein